MKKKTLIILLIIILMFFVIGYFILNYFLSNYMFDERGFPHFQSRKENLIELRDSVNRIESEEEKNEFINNCLKSNMLTQEEADFILGITDKI